MKYHDVIPRHFVRQLQKKNTLNRWQEGEIRNNGRRHKGLMIRCLLEWQCLKDSIDLRDHRLSVHHRPSSI